MKNLETALIDPEPADSEALENFLLAQQNQELREFVGFVLGVSEKNPAERFNTWSYMDNDDANKLPALSVQEIEDVPGADDSVRRLLGGRHLLYYGPASLGGRQKLILISRPGERLVLRGKMSHFGGAADTGMAATEGLALVSERNFAAVIQLHRAKVSEKGGAQALFVNPNAVGKPLGHNLNPKAYYLAMRWKDHGLARAILHHADTVVEVGNLLTGNFLRATPVDFGPATWTGRIADLSPGLADALELVTDQECCVRISLPQGAAVAKAGPADGYKLNLVTIASRQQMDFGGHGEAEEPLKSQIALYWKAVDNQQHSTEEWWSAAFISWCVKEAGATDAEFEFSGLHARYVHRAITSPNAAFRGMDISDAAARPEPGDIINHNFKSGTVTFEDAGNRNDFHSHSAIVVEKGEDAHGRFVRTIGGNEATREHQSGTVGDSIIRLEADGRIKDRDTHRFIALIKTLK
ncbi:DUF2272 domain-containing protein [Luteolibacter yonseiensis]|uniref:DUF2272 domain-containing protein n=1 Tax=Luteolibacter yonseiensis TaxID=1144680 RepID=A0A934R2G1_9BACT|nr:DUF2272 domain-containing protein [Luteolibacter yonseiensis]MBK1815771.1 DUF2272 domain-containing protein [Luteolibacter yonseiensis]